METTKFRRKPFEVEAVKVTAENIQDVATWCEGFITSEGERQYVKVSVANVINERQYKAFVGDWVLKAATGYKVYTAKAFSRSFERVDGVEKDAAVQASKGELEELRTVTS